MSSKTPFLEDFEDSFVSLITNDGRNLIGFLRGSDEHINVILENSSERVYGPNGTATVPLGLYVVRGDNIAVIGEIDPDLDERIDFKQIKATPLPPLII
eukprot:TRINITY_DN1656_c0_g1_i1.p1 TRINITY_DN1656_c0_g1~~TRINITY_DN1656_c0_g1_i1.p1  ORF type:complete len:110 (-),score=30.89 TRINITY_DN1656_c0_g1_i1:44-340(-)